MKRRGIRLAAAAAAAAALVLTSAALWAATAITIVVNGRVVASDVPPFMQGDRVFVPIRFVSEALGARVDWNGTTRTVTITTGAGAPAGGTLTLLGGDPDAAYPAPVGQVNKDISFIVDSVTRTSSGTVVRLRFRNASGQTVSYNADTKLWIGNTYYPALKTDAALLGNMMPGAEVAGNVTFGPIQAAVSVKLTGSFSVPASPPVSFSVNVTP